MIDMHLEERMSNAVDELRDTLERESVPTFEPTRSWAPLAAAAALVMLLGLGVLWTSIGRNEDPSGGIVVATQPEPESALPEPALPEPAVPEAASPGQQEAEPAALDQLPKVGQLSAAAAGEFIVPSPGVSAWNADETAVLLYRTGNTDVGHIVLSSTSGELLAEVDLSPPDIEQVYWHPTDPTLLIAVEGDAVWSFDIGTAERNQLHVLENCPQADADAGHPSPLSTTGTLVVLCGAGQGSEQGQLEVQYNVVTGSETALPAVESVDSVHVSPSGSVVVSVLTDGSAIARGAGADVALDLGGDVFAFVTVDGVEQIAAARYGGDAIGSVVLFDLADGSTQVVIGPEAGDSYPAPGTDMSGVGTLVLSSTSGPANNTDADGPERAGQVFLTDLASSSDDQIVMSFEHRSEGTHGYWSDAFVSLSPTGRYAVYSTDNGGDRVDTYVVEFSP